MRVSADPSQEPLAEVVALMGRTDVLLGMHGGSWANALFLKGGAAALQLFPYGWGRPGSRLRGCGPCSCAARTPALAMAGLAAGGRCCA